MDIKSVEWEKKGETNVPTVHLLPSSLGGIFKLNRIDGADATGNKATVFGVEEEDAKLIEEGDASKLAEYIIPNSDGLTYRIAEKVRLALKTNVGTFSSRTGGILEEFDAHRHTDS